MSWNYENYLKQELYKAINSLGLDIGIEVCEEQLFTKMQAPIPNTVYCVIKYLSTDIVYNSLVRPIQVLIVSEGNQMHKAKELFDYFAANYNWKLVTYNEENGGVTYVKQQYSTPVVISNFNDIGYDFRSVLYLSGTLIIMENVVDVQNLKIAIWDTDDNEFGNLEEVYPISFQMQYTVSGDTQQIGGSKIAKTIKSTATLSVALIIAPKESDFLERAIKISNGDLSGNLKFKITYSIDAVNFVNEMVLTSFSITTQPNDAPAISLSFMR